MDGRFEPECLLQDLLSLHHQKKSLLNEMLAITVERCALGEERAGEIIKHNETRQKCINSINVLDEQILQQSIKLEQIKRQVEEVQAESISLEWEKVKVAVESEKQLVQEMLKLDSTQREKMKSVLFDLQGKLQKIRFGRKMLKAYRGRIALSGSAFVDKKK